MRCRLHARVYSPLSMWTIPSHTILSLFCERIPDIFTTFRSGGHPLLPSLYLYGIRSYPRCAGLSGILPRLDTTITEDNLEKISFTGYPAEHWVDCARFEDVLGHTNDGEAATFIGTPLHYAALCGFPIIVKVLIIGHSQVCTLRTMIVY